MRIALIYTFLVLGVCGPLSTVLSAEPENAEKPVLVARNAADGKTLAAAVSKRFREPRMPVVFWDLASGKHATGCCPVGIGGGAIKTMAYTPDGNRLMLGFQQQVELWGLRQDRLEASFTAEKDSSLDEVAVSPDGQYIGARFRGTTRHICVWKLPPPKKDE